MKLKVLVNLLKEYDESWYAWFFDDPKEVIEIKKYVQQFKNESEDHELTCVDIFNLMKIIPLASKHKIICAIKNNLNNSYLVDIFDVLFKAKLLNKDNFAFIYEMSVEGRSFLYNLYCSSQENPISLKPEILETLLIISKNTFFPREKIEKSFYILKNADLLIPLALNLFKENPEELKAVCQLIEALNSANYLNTESLEYLYNLKSLSIWAALINLLNKGNITINIELLSELKLNNNLSNLLDLLPILINSKNCIFDKNVLLMLLKQDYNFFLYKTPSLKLLQKHEMLDSKAFELVCNNDNFFLMRNLEILSDQSLFRDNQELVSILLNQEIDSHQVYQAIEYLIQANLFNQTLLACCVNLLLSRAKNKSNNKNLLDLFKLFADSNFFLKSDMLEKLMSLSESNFQRVYIVVLNLKISKLLDSDSITTAIDRVSEKFPSVEALKVESFKIVENSEKNTDYPTKVVLNSKHLFFMNPTKSYRGGFGVVNRVYNSERQCYAIKQLKESDLDKSEEEAKREVRYNRLFGREAFYFSSDGKKFIFSEWQYGKALTCIKPRKLAEVSIRNRLKCLVSGLSDLNTMHARYRVHGDVKSDNYILNLKKFSMKLIDFGTSHKKNSSKTFAWTPEYSDPNLLGDHFCKDIYAMGIVTAHLFPELYTVTFAKKTALLNIKKTEFTVYEQAIINLVNSMMNLNHKIRCTSEVALTYCNELLKNFDDLNETLLENITKSTLNHSDITVEDVFREAFRVSN